MPYYMDVVVLVGEGMLIRVDLALTKSAGADLPFGIHAQ